ncbi:MAG: hypothetical protein PHR35_23205, partial [Kiritimatiellae bacterium]|nr:hypothetical protein [Kiritimatiellia bacterium]
MNARHCVAVAQLCAVQFLLSLTAISAGGDVKWWQPPDTTLNGFDVDAMATRPYLLADDFLCTNSTPITSVVVWGSWREDWLPVQQGQASPSNVVFTLSIHADVPPNIQAPWSMPGPVLWWTNFAPGSFTAAIEMGDIKEGWYNPATTNWNPNGDTNCWRYEFPMD